EQYARAWSPHRLRDVNETKIFTTGNLTTGVIVRIREMSHVHAYAGYTNVTNSITYRLRIRAKGSGTWLQTLGPYTRSISAGDPRFSRHNWRHALHTHAFTDLPPAEYEIEITVTDKVIAWGAGLN